MVTYWLVQSMSSSGSLAESPVSDSSANNDLPGEITHNRYALGALSYNPLPGRKTKKDEKVTARVPPSGVTKVAEKKHTIGKQKSKQFQEGNESDENGEGQKATEQEEEKYKMIVPVDDYQASQGDLHTQ